MKLSKAIRRGAKTGPQAFGVSRDGDATCAIGAALVALKHDGESYMDIVDFCPVARLKVRHPLTGEDGYLMVSVIRELNDAYLWTRERIADWVETIETDPPA